MVEEINSPLAVAEIPTPEGVIKVDVWAGKPLFILGRNGSGKSALANRLVSQWRDCVYMPGSRPSYFDSESLSMTAASRKQYDQNISYYNSPDSRWKSLAGTIRNEKAIHDLQAAETQYKVDAANQIKVEGTASSAIARLQADNSPLDNVNFVLNQANLSVRLVFHNGELQASQSGNTYSIAKMSDGERSAMVFSAEVVAAPPGTLFLIDEPELHLHPSIVISLIRALILHRPDCGFVVCTHELNLPIAVREACVLLVRDSSWVEGSIASWTVEVIQEPPKIPEWLWVDVIGARRKLLFVEGNDRSSLDLPLYSLLFPQASVRPQETCKDVVKAVEGLRAVESVHRARAFGLIDHDGMSDEQLNRFEENGIYPLPIFSVESLIYSSEALAAVAALQSEVLGVPPESLLSDAARNAFESLAGVGKKEYLASRVAERHIRDRVLAVIPTRHDLTGNGNSSINLSFDSPYPAELQRLEALVGTENLQGIVMRYPVRESGVLNGIAKGLRFSGRDDYERAVLRRVSVDPNLRIALKGKMGNLAQQLD